METFLEFMTIEMLVLWAIGRQSVGCPISIETFVKKVMRDASINEDILAFSNSD